MRGFFDPPGMPPGKGASGWQTAQRFIDASATTFQLLKLDRGLINGFGTAHILHGHLEATEFDHQVVAQEERVQTHGGGGQHGSELLGHGLDA